MEPFDPKGYLKNLKKRGEQGRVSQRFQMIGLEIATALKDIAHKALYIKYAKELGEEKMLALAKDVASRRDVKNPAAYFMKMVKEFRITNSKSQVTQRKKTL